MLNKPICHPDRKYKAKGLCKRCYNREAQKRWRVQNPWKSRVKQHKTNLKHKLKRHFGISLEEYTQMLTEQGGHCATCDYTPPTDVIHGDVKNRKLAVDHNHATGAIRGLLCNRCNIVLGLVKDSPIILEQLVRYLSKP